MNRKEKLLDLALDGILSKEDLKSKRLIIENEITDLKAKLKECQKQSTKKNNQKQYLNILQENILKNIDVNESNLENYIEKFLDKIIVKDNEEKSELQIILNTKELININMSDKLRQLKTLSDKEYLNNITNFKHLSNNKNAQIKKLPLCHSHTHSYCLFSITTTFLKKSIHIKGNSR